MDKEIIKALCNAVILLGGNKDILPILKELQNGKVNKELLLKLKDFNLDCEESIKFRLSNRTYTNVLNFPTTGIGDVGRN